MIPTDRPQQAAMSYDRFSLACICAVLILAFIGGAGLCATSLADIKCQHADGPGKQEGGK